MVDETIIEAAAISGKCIRIRYQSIGDRRARWRTVEPYSYRIINGRRFLKAFDINDRRDPNIHNYLVDGILRIRTSSRRSRLRWPVEIP